MVMAGAVGLPCLVPGASAQRDLQAQGPEPAIAEFEAQVRKVACAASRTVRVPPEIIEGVILAEDVLNRSWVDNAQDAIVRFFLEHRDEGWWEKWAADSEQLAAQSFEARRLANKWPTTLVLSGYVTSLGLAQITPRTALMACAYMGKREPCPATPRQIVTRLLDPFGAAEIAAVVLDYEADRYKAVQNVDVRQDGAMWATLYNAGGDFIAAKAPRGAPVPINAFGWWVAGHVAKSNGLTHCDPAAGGHP